MYQPEGMFNRYGRRLTIAEDFKRALQQIQACRFEWLDCEALSRRHDLARGTLVILDVVLADLTYEQRRKKLAKTFEVFTDLDEPMPGNSVCLSPAFAADMAETLWQALQQCNEVLACEFFEGMLAKRADSHYPIQLRSAQREFPGWVKHRYRPGELERASCSNPY